jgi:hypothetical protein
MANGLNRHFSKEDMQTANTREKMLSSTTHLGNANQNHSMSPSLPMRMATTKKAKTPSNTIKKIISGC